MAAKSQFKASAPLMARIKKMMQADEDVGKVAKPTPVLISKALDLFLHVLVSGAARVAEERGARTLTASHVKAHIQADTLLDFCGSLVAGVPDLPPPDAAEPAASPRAKRAKVQSDGGKGGAPVASSARSRAGSARGRGRRQQQGAHSGAGAAAEQHGPAAHRAQHPQEPGLAAAGKLEDAGGQEAGLPGMATFTAAPVVGIAAEEDDYDDD